jgi:CubicO group peptidase (beta-lactamase class C family)
MKKILQVIAFFLVASTIQAQQLDTFVQQYATQGKKLGIRSNFNGVVLVAKNNQILLNKAYGFANFKTKEALTPNSKFLIGSLTKPYVALLILQQVEKGTIKLQQPITDFLPYINKEKGKLVTIHHLLANTSGIPHYDGLRGHIKNMRTFSSKKMTPTEYAQLVDKTGLSAIPDSKYQYSSLGYVLLGAVLEEVTGLSFAQLIENYIANPLQLKNTGFGDNDFLKNEIVKNYRFRKENYSENPNRDQSNTYTAGGMHATAKEIFSWSQALQQNKLLKRRFTKKLFKENLNGYAYGWMRNDVEVLKYIPHAQFYGHSGSVNGFTSYLFNGDDGTTIIVLCNTSPIQPYKLVSDIYRKVQNEDLSKSTRIILPGFRSKAQFLKEGGYAQITTYHNLLTKSAGFKVFPSGGYLQRVTRMHVKEKMDTTLLEVLLHNLIKQNQNAEDLINRAAYEFAKTDAKKGLYYFTLNTKHFSKSANTWDSLGEFHEQQKQLSKAEKAYTKAITVAKKHFHTNTASFEKNLARVKKGTPNK